VKAAAVLALIVAIVLAIWALGNFVEDSNRRDQAVKAMLDNFPTHSSMSTSSFNSSNREADEAESAEERDGIMALGAVTFLIGSLVMFSQTKKEKANS
jgi:hypothetical protein